MTISFSQLPDHAMIRYSATDSDQQRLFFIQRLKQRLPSFMETEGMCFKELFCHKLVFDPQGARVDECIKLFKEIQERFTRLGSDFRIMYFQQMIKRIKGLTLNRFSSIYSVCKAGVRNFFIKKIKESVSGQELHRLIQKQSYILGRIPLDYCFALCADKHPWNFREYQQMLDDLIRDFSLLLNEEKKVFLDHHAYVDYKFDNDSVLYRVCHAMKKTLQEVKQKRESLLFKATWANDIKALEEIVKQKEVLGYRDHNGWSALHIACFRKHAQALKVLMQSGILYRERTKGGETPLQLAAERGFFEGIDLLLDHGEYSQKEKKEAAHGAISKGIKEAGEFIFFTPLQRAQFLLEAELRATGEIYNEGDAKKAVKRINAYQRRINFLSSPSDVEVP